jgi:hypothetical protein
VTVHDAVSQDAAGRSICAECGFEAPSLDKSMQLVTCTDHDVFFALSPGMRRDLLEAQQEVLDRLAQAN